jgi:hypothetical protein
MAGKRTRLPVSEEFNVFISWSGHRSRDVAQALRAWLPRVVQAARPWMSEDDIEKGTVGVTEIWERLAGCRAGIVCVTPENQNAPWLNFEAGALSKAINDQVRVCPFLVGVTKTDIKGPVAQLQLTTSDETDSLRMVKAICRAIGADIGDDVLEDTFKKFWPDLSKDLSKLPSPSSSASLHRPDREILEEILALMRQRGRVFAGGTLFDLNAPYYFPANLRLDPDLSFGTDDVRTTLVTSAGRAKAVEAASESNGKSSTGKLSKKP